MNDPSDPSCDADLRDRIVSGVDAVSELNSRFRGPLERMLVGMCDKHDGRSREKAVDIASQVIADCFVKSPSLLKQWKGGDNLDAFLKKAAANRLKSWWKSAEHRKTEVNSESSAISSAHGSDEAAIPDELSFAAEALNVGVTMAKQECADGLLFLRLKGLDGVPQREISRCWGHHETQTSRRISRAMEIIRSQALEHAEKAGRELELDSLQGAIRQCSGILLGDSAVTEFTPALEQSIRVLAAGKLPPEKRDTLVSEICDDRAARRFLAGLLLQPAEAPRFPAMDPELEQMRPRLLDRLDHLLERLPPATLGEWLTPLMKQQLHTALTCIGAEGGTLWILHPEQPVLEAVFNPLEPEITGLRQPLVSGIISVVLATGEAMRISSAGSDSRHSPAVDVTLGKSTNAMMAVPFSHNSPRPGILTAVRWKSTDPFSAEDEDHLTMTAETLTALLNQEISRRILG